MGKSTSQNLTVYLGSDEQRKSRIKALDRLARGHVPESLINRAGSERSVLFQLLADNEGEAAAALDLFFSLIGHGSGEPPPPVILWNGLQWAVKYAHLR